MGDWWVAIILGALIIAMVAYALWTTYFINPKDAAGAGAPGKARDHYDRREQSEAMHPGSDRTRGLEEPGTPLS